MSRITEAQTLAQLRAGVQIVNPDTLAGGELSSPVNVSLPEEHQDFNILEWLENIYTQVTQLNSASGAPAEEFFTGQESVNSTASAVVVNQAADRGVMLSALVTNSSTIFIGNTGSVDEDNGFPLEPGENLTLGVGNVNEIFAVTASGTETVAWLAV